MSRCVKVQRKFIKFTIIYQIFTVSSRGVKIRLCIWNTFKRKTEVLKINLIADTATGLPVSF